MNAILIDPLKKEISDVSYTDERDMESLINCNWCYCVEELTNGDALYADEEANTEADCETLNSTVEFFYKGIGRICGVALLLRKYPEGNVLTSLDDVRKNVRWLD